MAGYAGLAWQDFDIVYELSNPAREQCTECFYGSRLWEAVSTVQMYASCKATVVVSIVSCRKMFDHLPTMSKSPTSSISSAPKPRTQSSRYLLREETQK
jgi:hypothetical protein